MAGGLESANKSERVSNIANSHMKGAVDTSHLRAPTKIRTSVRRIPYSTNSFNRAKMLSAVAFALAVLPGSFAAVAAAAPRCGVTGFSNNAPAYYAESQQTTLQQCQQMCQSPC